MDLIHEIKKRREATNALLGQLYQYRTDHYNNILIPRYSLDHTIRELELLQVRLQYALEVEEISATEKEQPR